MKFYVKQHVFAWTDRLSIKDADGNDAYDVKGRFFSFGRQLRVNESSSGKEAALISRKLFAFRHKYYIQLDGVRFTMVHDFTLFRPSYHIEEIPYVIKGDFFAHEYSVFETVSNSVVMTISKRWLTWGDAYEIEIDDSANWLLCLCIVIALDAINADHDSD